MSILITGATGYIGSRVASLLAGRGEKVIGVIRSPERASALPTDVEPLVCDLTDVSRLATAAKEAKAIIHTGFTGHGGVWDDAVAVDKAVITGFIEALEGTGKRLIVSNGTIFLGDTRDGRLTEAKPVIEEHPAAGRARATAQAREAANRGVHGIELRLASFVYGLGGSVFPPVLVNASQAAGFAFYVGDGRNKTSTVHVDAAASAFVQALDHGDAGGLYHIAGDEEPMVLETAHAIGIGQNLPVRSLTGEEATALTDPFTAAFLAIDNRIDSTKAREALGWSPAGHVPFLFDLAHGSYAKDQLAILAA